MSDMEEQMVNPLDMIDPRQAFGMLQEYHGMEMSRLAGDIATKNTFIMLLQKELRAAQERITALEQNAAESNGKATPGGADLSSVEMPPKAPASLRKGQQHDH